MNNNKCSKLRKERRNLANYGQMSDSRAGNGKDGQTNLKWAQQKDCLGMTTVF